MHILYAIIQKPTDFTVWKSNVFFTDSGMYFD